MNGVLAVARRELIEKKLIFAGALLIGILVTIVPLARDNRDPEIVSVAAFYVAIAVCFGSAFAGGASVVARDLSERRMTFFFARPLSSHAVFLGKLLAAFLMSLAVGALVMLPPSFVGEGFVRFMRPGGVDLGPGELRSGVAVLTVVVFLVAIAIVLGHGFSIVLRSRSKWIALDFAAILGFAGGLWLMVQPILGMFAVDVFGEIVGGGAVSFLVCLFVASWMGFVRGRTDLVRIHRAQAIALACGLAAALALGAGYVGWVMSVDADDLDGIWQHTNQASGGFDRWADFSGVSAGRLDYAPRFLYDMETGALTRIAVPPVSPVVFSADGRWAVWGQTTAAPWESTEMQLVRAELGRTIRTQELQLWIRPYTQSIALSSDGSRLAVLGRDGLLTVTDLDTGASVASLKLPDGEGYTSPWFLTPDKVRAYSRTNRNAIKPSVFSIHEADLVGKRAVALGTFEAKWMQPITGGDVILTRGPRQVLDGKTGLPVLELPFGLITGLRRLEDGRVLYTRIEDGRARLVIRDPAGAEIRSIDLGAAERVATGDLLPDQQLVAATATAKDSWKGSSLFVVDLMSGQARKVADDLVPAMDGYWYAQRVSEGRGLYTSHADEHENLVAFNPLTGERKHVAGRR